MTDKTVSYEPECWCDDADTKWECKDCGVQWVPKKNTWEFMKGYSYYYKCRHSHFPVYFEDGVVVHASSHVDRENEDEAPDWGLYLDSIWRPTSMAGFIEWEDFGLPTNWQVAARMIVDAYRRAMADYWVEVSCIGGHGRTGTVLACMAVLSGKTPDEAIQYVRGSYCKKAIETDEQEWYVSYFNAYVNGGSSAKFPGKKGKNASKNVGRQFVFSKGIDWKRKSLFGKPGRLPSTDEPTTINYRYTSKPAPKEGDVDEFDEEAGGDDYFRYSEEGFVEYCLSEITAIMADNELTATERDLLDRWCSKYVENRKAETT